ncbi:protein of unknown function DUF343 [Syntrophotalea carbinolica DSM 2380]|uniref:UPF0434 protein Pcar_1262 n=1 Tax=Syntrophotalea carbinolica (strain DSM 2380 / NBRC 103641 / GraBd1) TaxID=338963 RepID=Q3A546_SYNC1|nr:Trm112 family protein [Syntrophotalea carbinolica]ABA88511.1 protein of unknown function DUF343 [Syntrophotalea carbinolica DSM 2380]
MAISQELLEILACPQCKGAVRQVEAPESLICDRCCLKYPVEDGIPVMLVEEAQPLEDCDKVENPR